jgi:hypothetical protein
VPAGYRKRLSDEMAARSPEKNRRVGLGEAAIFRYIEKVAKGLFEDIRVKSDDSDVNLLAKRRNAKVEKEGK